VPLCLSTQGCLDGVRGQRTLAADREDKEKLKKDTDVMQLFRKAWMAGK